VNLKTGNIWTAWKKADLLLISTSGSLTNKGKLVMSRGIAAEALERFPGVDAALGKSIQQKGKLIEGGAWMYYLLTSDKWPEAKLGCFQSKHLWSTLSSMDVIVISWAFLFLWIQDHPTAKIHMNFPGIGLGLLPEWKVMPYLEQLPDTVTVWKKP
jgi:hypothetical protein